jgi:oligopeptide/dipeptide ABC transporter ATP-binding protein
MYGGRFVEEGSTEELFERPLHPYTAGLLRSTPRVSDHSDRLQTIEGSPPSMLTMPVGCSFYERCSSRMAKCKEHDPPLMIASTERTAACFLVEKGEVQ